jgi:hypothetical protein
MKNKSRKFDRYVNSLDGFHKDTMAFINSLDVYERTDRLDKAAELNALIKQGEKIKEFDFNGDVHTTD